MFPFYSWENVCQQQNHLKTKYYLNKFDNVIKQNLEIQKIGLIFEQVILTLKV